MERFSVRLPRVWAIFLLLVAVEASAQSDVGAAGSDSDARATALTQPDIPTSGPFGGLIVFVRFRDDQSGGDCSPSNLSWPVDAELPDFAEEMGNPESDRSLHHYFAAQSQGTFDFRVSVYDHVVVTAADERAYGPTILSTRRLSEEVLDVLDADPDFDFRDFDLNRDGWFDHLFIVVRRLNATKLVSAGNAGGVSSLGFSYNNTDRFDGIRIHSGLSGSYNRYGAGANILPMQDLTRLLAHEFGHDLWRAHFRAHMHPIRGNGVPNDGSGSSAADRTSGYGLMIGEGASSTRVYLMNTMSAYERSLLGANWIACDTLATDATVVLGDMFTRHDCAIVELGGSFAGGRLYVSNRQRSNYFDWPTRPTSRINGECIAIDRGLGAEGLMVEYVRDGSSDRDLIPADGYIRNPDGAEFATAFETVAKGDLFDPRLKSQLTPWTRPNANGHFGYRRGQTPGWQALTNIRYTGGSGGEMAFDYVTDFRTRPVITADSWIGAETSDYRFESDIVVEPGATLTIGGGADIAMAPRRRIIVRGRLIIGDAMIRFERGMPWDGIVIADGGELVFGTR